MAKLTLSKWKVLVVLFIMILGSVVYLEIAHYFVHGHFFSYGLHVDVLNRDSHIGIPGQTKIHWAEVSNYTLWPINLTACDYISDVLSPGTEYPYAVQIWDQSQEKWQTVIEPAEEDFCLSTLGRGQTDVVIKRLWPGMTTQVMEGEATGARIPFKKGDMARFVVFRKMEESMNWQTAIPSPPFIIEDDVKRDEEDSFRVNH